MCFATHQRYRNLGYLFENSTTFFPQPFSDSSIPDKGKKLLFAAYRITLENSRKYVLRLLLSGALKTKEKDTIRRTTSPVAEKSPRTYMRHACVSVYALSPMWTLMMNRYGGGGGGEEGEFGGVDRKKERRGMWRWQGESLSRSTIENFCIPEVATSQQKQEQMYSRLCQHRCDLIAAGCIFYWSWSRRAL